jgi:hypothetical protein
VRRRGVFLGHHLKGVGNPHRGQSSVEYGNGAPDKILPQKRSGRKGRDEGGQGLPWLSFIIAGGKGSPGIDARFKQKGGGKGQNGTPCELSGRKLYRIDVLYKAVYDEYVAGKKTALAMVTRSPGLIFPPPPAMLRQ